MRCPSCKLENPATATRCDCGYPFSSASSDSQLSLYLWSIDNSLRTIRRIVVAWAVLTIIGACVWMVRHW